MTAGAAPGAVRAQPPTHRVGEWRVTVLNDGFQRLDGGAMFGVVPKPLWERRIPADERNRIRLALRCLLLEGPGGPVLVDTGIGSKEEVLDPKFCDIYGVERPEGLRRALEGRGIAPDDVRLVVNTHLHFDHCGGNTALDERERIVPAFPRARYVAVRGEWEDALAANERNRASYRPDNFVPLRDAGVLDLVEPDAEILPGLRYVHAPGHTRFHQVVRVDGADGTLAFLADLAPTASHLSYPYIMAYDLFPLESLATKKRLLPHAAREGWRVVLEHEPGPFLGRLALDERGAPLWLPEEPASDRPAEASPRQRNASAHPGRGEP